MKKFLAFLIAILIAYLISPFYCAAITAWVWLPIVFVENNILGGFWLGLVLGLFILLGTAVVYNKLFGDD